jgi:hypothetical protein
MPPLADSILITYVLWPRLWEARQKSEDLWHANCLQMPDTDVLSQSSQGHNVLQHTACLAVAKQ